MTRFDTGYPRGDATPDQPAADALDAAREEVPSAIALLERGMDEGLHPGVQLYVSRAGEVLVDAGLGWARAGEPMTERTLLPWFCGVKPAVAIAFAQLWEAGLVRPDTPVSAIVPEFSGGGKELVTYRHLLTHSVGLSPDPVYAVFGRPREEVMQAISSASLPAGKRPGHHAYYSSLWAWFMLGETLERLSGLDYHAYMDERVFRPLGLDDVYTVLTPETAARVADRIGLVYHVDCADPVALPYLCQPEHFDQRIPGLDGIGPVSRLGRLLEALMPGAPAALPAVISEQTREAMTARHRVGLYDFHYGSYISWGLGIAVDGWYFGAHCSPRAFGHSGMKASFAVADPAHELVVAGVANGMPGGRESLDRDRGVVDAVYRDLGLAGEPAAPRILEVEPERIPDWGQTVLRENRYWRVDSAGRP